MKTIQDVLDWLQEAENDGIYTCGTQNVKRHLESVQKHQALSQHDVIKNEVSVCEHKNKTWTINQADQRVQKCKDCGKYN